MTTHAAMTAGLAISMIVGAAGGDAFAAGKKGAKAKKPRPRAEPCMRFSEAHTDDGDYQLELRNGCRSSRECTMSWTMTCEGEEPVKQAFQVVLLVDGEETWTIPTSQCETAYKVSPPTWACTLPAPLVAR
jgi:hypothetical protein